MVLYICVKFCENITNGIRVIERTRVHERNVYVQKASVSRQTRITIHVCCTSSHGALHWCEVLKNISNGFIVMERARNYEARTDGRSYVWTLVLHC